MASFFTNLSRSLGFRGRSRDYGSRRAQQYADLGDPGRTEAGNLADSPIYDEYGFTNRLPGTDVAAEVQYGSEIVNARRNDRLLVEGQTNALAALEAGVTSFESSFGELGGCPVPPGATGNIATEDLVSMLEEMGVGTGVDLAKLIDASAAAQKVLGRPLGAHSLVAGPVDWAPSE